MNSQGKDERKLNWGNPYKRLTGTGTAKGNSSFKKMGLIIKWIHWIDLD
jgi:hypothetical protein